MSVQSLITLAGSPVNGVRRLIPAFFTKTEIGPIRPDTVAAIALHAAGSVMSRVNASAKPPAARIDATVSPAPSPLTSSAATRAPYAGKADGDGAADS
jgi:hypothetical protein